MDDDMRSVASDVTECVAEPGAFDAADRVKVAVRVRPFTVAEIESGARCIINMKDNSTDVLDPTYFSGESDGVEQEHYTRRFNFDHSFWSHSRSDSSYATQDGVFNALGEFLLGNALSGYNCSLFAYGQTGSGKTYTMLGGGEEGDAPEELGIVPRLCRSLFERVKQRRGAGVGATHDHATGGVAASSKKGSSTAPPPPPAPSKREDKENEGVPAAASHQPVLQEGRLLRAGVVVSFYEIYNEQVRDLFSGGAAPGAARPGASQSSHNLRVREDPKTGVFVENLTSHPVKTYGQVMNLLEVGTAHRTTASTIMNATSSRSHAVFTLTLRAEIEDPATPGTQQERTSKISLVDLAGSERANSTGATADRLREAANINKSLSTLGDVIKALTRKSSSSSSSSSSSRGHKNFVPYRNSALTWLLKDSLGGNSKTVMLAAISPSEYHYNETMSTLRLEGEGKATTVTTTSPMFF